MYFLHTLGKCGNDTIMSPCTQYKLMNWYVCICQHELLPCFLKTKTTATQLHGSISRGDLGKNISYVPLACSTRRLNWNVLTLWPQKIQALCHSRCPIIKIPSCSNPVGADHVPNICTFNGNGDLPKWMNDTCEKQIT